VCTGDTGKRQAADARQYKTIRTHGDPIVVGSKGKGQVRINWLDKAFERDCIIIDTLHLLLRSFDNLLRHTLNRFIQYDLPYVVAGDQSARKERPAKVGKVAIERYFASTHFQGIFHSWAGISPFFVASKDAVNFQSLPGGKAKKFFEKCDWAKVFVKNKDLGEAVQRAWGDFYVLYARVCTMKANHAGADLAGLEEDLKTFATRLCSQVENSSITNLFDRTIHTPYMHLFCFHSAQMIRNLKTKLQPAQRPFFSLDTFSCQSLENGNKSDTVYCHNATRKDKATMNEDMMLAHFRRNLNVARVDNLSKTKSCLLCAKQYDYWGWLRRHYVLEHEDKRFEEGEWEEMKSTWKIKQSSFIETFLLDYKAFRVLFEK